MASQARDWVIWSAENRPDAPALRNGDTGWSLTWSQLEERVARLAGHLCDEYGIGKGDRVAAIAYANPRIFELQFACMRLGAILVPLNWRLADQELQEILARSEPSTIIWDGVMRDRASALSAAGPMKPGFGWDGGDEDSSTGYEARIAQARSASARLDTDYDEVTHILFTSGTTGVPKGSLTTQRNMVAQAINNAHTSGVAEPGCHHLNPMPLFHAGGLTTMATPLLMAGGASDSNRARYSGTSPDAASLITWALVFPTSGIFCSRAEVMAASSSRGRSATAAAALRKARTLYDSAPSRSRR